MMHTQVLRDRCGLAHRRRDGSPETRPFGPKTICRARVGVLVIAGDVAGQAENPAAETPAFVPSNQLLDCTSVPGLGHKSVGIFDYVFFRLRRISAMLLSSVICSSCSFAR